MTKHLMVDIETLDTAPTAVVLQVGWCVFDEQDILKKGQWDIDVWEQLGTRTISKQTVEWWLTQPTQPDLAGDTWIGSVPFVLAEVMEECERVWSRGFMDMKILENLGFEYDYWRWRDHRTMSDILVYDSPVSHEAMDDACNQALHLMEVWNVLRTSLGTAEPSSS